MRQLINTAYSAMTEWADKDEKEKLDRELAADDPSTVSHGTEALMAIMGAGGKRR